MNIGELSGRSGVSQRSLRYYEQQGLIAPERGANGYRLYAEGDVAVVQTIRTMYEIGFSRDEVATCLPCATGDADAVDAAAVRGSVESMRDELTARIDELTRTRLLLVDFLEQADDASRGACFA
jgi:DNA-binding transcriptional MerR regulator